MLELHSALSSFALIVFFSITCSAEEMNIVRTQSLADYVPGDWTEHCKDGKVNNNTLAATCKKNDGQEVAASLDLNSCLNMLVTSDDGVLRCQN